MSVLDVVNRNNVITVKVAWDRVHAPYGYTVLLDPSHKSIVNQNTPLYSNFGTKQFPDSALLSINGSFKDTTMRYNFRCGRFKGFNTETCFAVNKYATNSSNRQHDALRKYFKQQYTQDFLAYFLGGEAWESLPILSFIPWTGVTSVEREDNWMFHFNAEDKKSTLSNLDIWMYHEALDQNLINRREGANPKTGVLYLTKNVGKKRVFATIKIDLTKPGKIREILQYYLRNEKNLFSFIELDRSRYYENSTGTVAYIYGNLKMIELGPTEKM